MMQPETVCADSLGLAVTHLNASTGPVLTAEHLAKILRAGSVDVITDAPAAALASYLFVELEPRLIALCAYQAGTGVAQANRLYQDSLRHGMLRVPAWEQSVRYLL